MCIRDRDYRFEGEDTYDQLKNYISISDDQLTIEGQANVGFIGNVYAGGSQTDYNYDEGIVAGAQSTACLLYTSSACRSCRWYCRSHRNADDADLLFGSMMEI